MADFAAARLNMVESQVRTADVTDVRIHDAMRALPREQFVPAARAFQAYADLEVEYAPGRWLLKPRDVGKLIQALRPMPGERVLAISAPYAAAVMGELGAVVAHSEAGADLPDGPFDIIVCEGAVARAPDAWTARLAMNGRLGVVERSGMVGKACLYVRAADGIGRRELFDGFPPVLAGFEPQHGFAF
jgi:protein-L-isoaspartate(D-aspartate) O-methyltransferase